MIARRKEEHVFNRQHDGEVCGESEFFLRARSQWLRDQAAGTEDC